MRKKLTEDISLLEERAQKGIFLAFQYPLQISEVLRQLYSFKDFVKYLSENQEGEKELDTLSLLKKLIKEKSV